jgi:hypothetical protein
MSSKETKGKKPLKELETNPKIQTTMMHTNPKFQMGKPMLTVDTLKGDSKSCVVLHDYYINNYKKHQHIIGGSRKSTFWWVKASFSSHGRISMTLSPSMHWISRKCAASHSKSLKTSFFNIYTQYKCYKCLTNLAFCM